MFSHRPMPERLEQHLTVSKQPSLKLLGRTMHQFAGPWMLSHFHAAVVRRGGRCSYELDLAWRSDVGQYSRFPIYDAGVDTGKALRVRMYDDISWLDRLRLWLLTVESRVRQLLRRA